MAEIADVLTGPSTAQTDITIDWEVPAVYQRTSHDPMQFRPATWTQGEETIPTAPQTLPTLDIKGVLYSSDKPAAIIGTQLLHEGDEVAGARVIGIDRDGVEFDMNGRRWKQTVSVPAAAPGRKTGSDADSGS